MCHMVNHACALCSYSIKNSCHHLIAYLIGVEAIVVPDHYALFMKQVSEYVLRIAFNKIVMVITINENQIKLSVE